MCKPPSFTLVGEKKLKNVLPGMFPAPSDDELNNSTGKQQVAAEKRAELPALIRNPCRDTV